ncbi:MAG: hypothetical protein IKV76_03755 [Clostridia bacterium]|nr:hypothetical protein [Clostridia bacterium]
MAVRIKFDNAGNTQTPTFALANRKGKKLGNVPAYNIVFRDGLNTPSEISFRVNKVDNNVSYQHWDELKDFKLLYCKEWDLWFEIYVEISETNEKVKNVTGKSLGEAELSQIYLYDLEVNTETEIAKDDYEPSILYDENYPEKSLLHRVLEKAAHYKLNHVDFSISNIQRVFTFDNTTIYDALQAISQEINCLFVIDNGSDAEGNIKREINVYDLESFCIDCGHRGEFTTACDECGSKNISTGYGEYTSIYICSENLADDITFTTDNGSVKNCFKLVAGDDTLTDIIANCNPNGSGYIWYLSDELKSDMTEELIQRLNEYDETYSYYQNEYTVDLSGDKLTAFNELITKYNITDYKTIADNVTGYPELLKAYYQAVDFFNYINETQTGETETRTTAAFQAANLNSYSLSPVAVKKLSNVSSDSAGKSVLAMAKTIVNSNYTVELIEDSGLYDVESHKWSGVFRVTNTKDANDTALTNSVSVKITDDYSELMTDEIEKVLAESKPSINNIITLFKYDDEIFTTELKKYSLTNLNIILDAAQSVLDTLIKEGVADKDTWANQSPDLYRDMYKPYYDKFNLIKAEIKLRESEIKITTDLLTMIDAEKVKIQNALNFEQFLNNYDLWLDFIAYRRESTYQNDNYTSDGLSNIECYETAIEFIEVAKKEIYKSATLQHSITATLKNLLVMKEFKPIVDYFSVGNWIQLAVDDKLYRLRLLDYEINFDNLNNIAITFSDVKQAQNSVSDVESILNQAASMATSYGSLLRQTGQNKKSSDQLNDWVNKGLALTKMKIIDSAENQNITWDNHGLLCKEYLPITDTYDDKQLKLINRGLYLTDDNWLTSKAGIGDFTFYNPETGRMEEAYGVIADTLVGNLILSERVGVYNTNNSITLNDRGLTITADAREDNSNQTLFNIDKLVKDVNGNDVTEHILYIDSDGLLTLTGNILINSSADTSIKTLDDLCDTSRFNETIANTVHQESQNIYSDIDKKYVEIITETTKQLEAYKADIGQYMQFGDDGLTLGATTSQFKTVIDNQGMYFKQGDTIVSYVNNNQLHIPNAVIEHTLILGDFFFSPRADGGVSLTWQGD